MNPRNCLVYTFKVANLTPRLAVFFRGVAVLKS